MHQRFFRVETKEPLSVIALSATNLAGERQNEKETERAREQKKENTEQRENEREREDGALSSRLLTAANSAAFQPASEENKSFDESIE